MHEEATAAGARAYYEAERGHLVGWLPWAELSPEVQAAYTADVRKGIAAFLRAWEPSAYANMAGNDVILRDSKSGSEVACAVGQVTAKELES